MVPYKPQKLKNSILVGSVLVHPAKDLLLIGLMNPRFHLHSFLSWPGKNLTGMQELKLETTKPNRHHCSVLLLFLLIHFMAVHEVVFLRAIMG